MRISYNDAAYILSYKKPHRLARICCTFEIVPTDYEGFRIQEYVKWPIFILAYIPAALLDFLACAWNGGVKYYTLPKRQIFQYTVLKWDYAADRIKERIPEFCKKSDDPGKEEKT